jgi:hypothetical protein
MIRDDRIYSMSNFWNVLCCSNSIYGDGMSMTPHPQQDWEILSDVFDDMDFPNRIVVHIVDFRKHL